jgi:hypothetical protein
MEKIKNKKVYNLHTGEVCKIENVEQVSNPPITVYVLSNGERWNERLFAEHWCNLITLLQNSEDIPEKFAKVINEDFWEII